MALTEEERTEKIAQLKALEQAISTGALRIEYADKRIEYKHNDQILQAIALLKNELGLLPRKRSRRQAIFDRGL